MSDADLVAVEGFDYDLDKLGQLQPLRDVGRRFSRLGRDLLDAVLRFLQIEKGAEPLSFLQRVDVFPLKVFDLSLVLQKLSMTSTTVETSTLWNSYL